MNTVESYCFDSPSDCFDSPSDCFDSNKFHLSKLIQYFGSKRIKCEDIDLKFTINCVRYLHNKFKELPLNLKVKTFDGSIGDDDFNDPPKPVIPPKGPSSYHRPLPKPDPNLPHFM